MMSNNDYIALRAKVCLANNYLEQVLRSRGKIDSYDIYKVVTKTMREHVEVVTPEQAATDGLGIVRIRQEVA